MESNPSKVILYSRNMLKVQALKAVIRDIGEMDIYAKSGCTNAKTVPQPIQSGKICAKKRIQKVEQVFRLKMRKNSILINPKPLMKRCS
jgi:non-canonical (house-cleaning) NTP pyrophosphatase